MRPIRLEIIGLQSFKEKQVIDFDKLTSLGLFGIFGETGSGKSTILDAMILAIFDEIPRMNGKGIRPCLNQDSDVIDVYFKFALGKNIFEIRRVYKKRVSKSGEEKFSQQSCLLKLNDEVLADKVRDVKEILNDMFGIDAKDFTRSVVLPQGKFSEFLKLSGDEKVKMLESIFDLEEYGTRLQNKIAEKKKEVNSKIEALNIEIQSRGEVSLENIDTVERELELNLLKLKEVEGEKENSLKLEKEIEEIRQLSEKKYQYESRLNELKERESRFLEIKEKLEKNEQGKIFLEKVNSIKTLEKELVQNENEMDFLKNKIEKLEKNLQIFLENEKDKRDELEKINFSLEKLNFDENLLDSLRNGLEIATKINFLQNILEETKESLEKNIFEQKSIEDILKNNIEKLETLEKEVESVEEISDEKISKLKEEIIYLETQLENIIKGKIEKDTKERELKELEEKILENRRQLEDLTEKVYVLEKLKNKNIAYYLAQNLQEGEKCLVCGSIHHPEKAQLVDEIDEKELERLNKEKSRLDKELTINISKIEYLEKELKKFIGLESEEKLSNEILEKRKEYEVLSKTQKEVRDKRKDLEYQILNLKNKNENLRDKKNELKENEERFSQKISIEIDEIEKEEEKYQKIDLEISFKNLEELRNKKIELENLERERRVFLQDKERLFLEITGISEEKEKIRVILEKEKINEQNVKNTLLSLKEKLSVEKQILKEEVEKSSFQNIDEIEKAILKPEDEEKGKNILTRYFDEKIKIENLLENILGELAGREYNEKSWREIKEKIDILSQNEKYLHSEITIQKNKIQNMRETFEKVKELLKKLEIVTREKDNVDILQKKIEGKKFMKYLAKRKLSYIVLEASKKLRKVTRGRYSLTINDNCDFNIVDSFNGNFSREASTLSGGETFVVSLSLALALSSQLQLKGSVKLEFFFLDEGFGTLDSILLDRVIEILEEIKWKENIKIGIISHVEDLKIRIPRRLEVFPAIPGEKGSTIKLI